MWFKEEITREIRIYFELNENGNTIYQNLGYAFYSALKGKSLAFNTYVSKVERCPINVLSFLLKKIKKDNKTQSKMKKEIIQIRAKIH